MCAEGARWSVFCFRQQRLRWQLLLSAWLLLHVSMSGGRMVMEKMLEGSLQAQLEANVAQYGSTQENGWSRSQPPLVSNFCCSKSSIMSVAFINGASMIVFLCWSFLRPKLVYTNMLLLWFVYFLRKRSPSWYFTVQTKPGLMMQFNMLWPY